MENPENEWMNPKFWTVLGYNPEEMPHKSSAWQNIINQDDLKVALDNFNKHCENPEHPYDQIVRYSHKNGGTVWIRCRGLAIRDKNGKPIRMLGAHHDISEQKKLHIEIEKSSQIYKNVIQSIPIGMFIYQYIAPDRLILIDGNSSAEKLTGIRVTDWIGKEFNEIWPNAKDAGITDSYLKVAKTGIGIDLEDTYYADERVSGAFRIYAFQFDNDKIAIAFLNVTEIKKAEEDLLKAKEKAEESESLLKAAMENSQAGIAIAEVPSGKLKFVNKAGLLIRSKDYEEIVKDIDINKYVASWQILHFDGTPFEADEVPLARAVLYGETCSIELIIRRDNNEDRYVWANAAPVFNKKGIQTSAIVIFLDITDRKIAENLLLNSKRELQRAQEIAHIGSWYLDIATNQVTWTEQLYKMYDFDPTQPVPPYTEHMKLFTPESWELLSSSLNHTRETGIPYELELKTIKKDGSNGWMWVRGEAIKDDEYKIIGLWGAAQDITERKNIEIELKSAKERAEDSEARLAEAQKTTKVGSWETDLSNFNVIWSAETYHIFELDLNTFEASHQAFLEFVHPDDKEKVDEAFVRSLKTKDYNSIEHRIITAKGTTKFVEERWKIEFDEQENPIRAIGTCQDITERKNIELIIKQNSDRLKILLSLSQMTEVENNELYNFALEKAIEICNSKIGFLGFLNEEETIVKIHAWSASAMQICEIKDKFIDFEVAKTGIWGEVIRQRKPLIINDYQEENPLKKGTPVGHVEILNYLSIPIFDKGKIVLVISIGNKVGNYVETDIQELTLLMEGVWNIVKQRNFEKELLIAKEKAEENKLLLEAKHELLSLFLRHSPIYAFIKIIEPNCSRVLYASDNFIDMVGISGTDMIGKTMHELFPPEFAEKITEDDISVTNKGEILEIDELLGDKSYITIKFPIIQKNNKLLAGYTIDITERKKIENELKIAKEKAEENEKRFKAQYNFLPVPTFTWKFDENDFNLIDYNISGENLTKGAVSKLIGIKASIFFRDYENVFDKMLNCYKNKTTSQYEIFYHYKLINEKQYLNFTFAYVEPDLLMVHSENITEKKLAQLELIKAKEKAEENEKLYKSLSESSKDYIMRFDKNYKQLYINKITYDLLQIKPEQLLNKTHRESGLFTDELCNFWEENITKVFETKDTVQIQFDFFDGHKIIYFDWMLIPEKNDIGEVENVLSVSRDITKIKKYELDRKSVV